MRKRTVNKKEYESMIEKIEGAETVLLITDKGTSFFGTGADILGAYAELTSRINTKTDIETNLILEACKLGLDKENLFTKDDSMDDKDLDEEIDKKIEAIEKMVELLKKLKEDK